jgi:O-antigen biosynthesis protein WbqL
MSRIAPGHAPPNRLRRLWPLSEVDSATVLEAMPVPPVWLIALPDTELRSDYMPYKGGLPVTSEVVFPRYVEAYFDLGHRSIAPVIEARYVDVPVFCVSHFNMATYGHFLMEVLPKLLLVRALQRAGLKVPLAFPSDAGAVSTIVATLFEPDELLFYESRRESLTLRMAVLPSMMTSNFRMHDIFVAATKLLPLEFAFAPSALQVLRPRIFLSRSKWKGYRTLTNEAELFELAAGYGFELVHPQDLPWPDQVLMYFSASHVISAYDSALHGTLFCPAGTRIIALGRVNGFQEAIGDSLGHELGFLDSVRGELAPYNPAAPKPQFYDISASELRRRLDVVAVAAANPQ